MVQDMGFGPPFKSQLFLNRCLSLPHSEPHLTNGGNHVPSSLVPGIQGTLHSWVTSPEPTCQNDGNPKLASCKARLPGEVEALSAGPPLFFSWRPYPLGVGGTDFREASSKLSHTDRPASATPSSITGTPEGDLAPCHLLSGLFLCWALSLEQSVFSVPPVHPAMSAQVTCQGNIVWC